MSVNPRNVIKHLADEFSTFKLSSISETERELARQLSGVLKERMVSNVHFEEDVDLVFEILFEQTDSKRSSEDVADTLMEEAEEEASSEEVPTQSSSHSSYHGTPAPAPVNRRTDIPFSKWKRAVEYWLGANKTRRTLSSVQKNFRFVESIPQLEYWKSQIATNGPRHEKLCHMTAAVKERFIAARIAKKSVHDADLRRWALQESRKVKVNFKASSGWLHHFKQRNRITSRKITKFVSKAGVEKSETIMDSAAAFVEKIRKKFANYSPDETFNTDQSGFQLELHSGRTLGEVGDKHVDASVQSVAATSHSYTVMPTVTASGKLLSPLVVVTKEPDGKFDPVVEHGLYKAPNILPIAAKSSMMGKKEIRIWFEKAFLPNAPPKSLLLVDSLNAYLGAKDASPKDKEVEIEVIPPNTTGFVQPLDVFFFRQWKNFCRKISDFVLTENVDFSLRTRNNIYKLQSLIHNQFSAPRFQTFRRYSWYKAGYFQQKAPAFINPVDFCFKSDELTCGCPGCDKIKLIKCAHCEKPLCIEHSLIGGHFHDVD